MLCVVVAFPSYELFFEPNEIVTKNWAVLNEQIEHPLTPLLCPPEEHYGQLAFRLLLPVMAHLLHLPLGLFFILLPVCGWSFFVLLQRLCRKAGLDAWSGLLVALGLAATYAGKAFFVDVIGYFDGYCYLLLLLSLLTRNQALALLAFFGSLYVDERAYLAVPLCAFCRFWLYRDARQTGLALLWLEAFGALGVLVVGLLLRAWLHTYCGLISGAQSTNLGLATLRDNFQVSTIGLLSGLDFWLYVAFIPAWYLWQQKGKLLAGAYVIYLGGCLIAMLLVLDLTRCTAYLFPAVLAGVFAMARAERPAFTEYMLAIFCAIALLFPPLFVVGDYILWMGPVFPKLFRVVARLSFGIDI